MCVLSMVHDYYRDKGDFFYNPYTGNWDYEAIALLKQAIDILEKLDKKLGDKECKDPEKTKWLQEMEEIVKKLKGKST